MRARRRPVASHSGDGVPALPQDPPPRAAGEAATAIVASTFTVSIGASYTAVAADVVVVDAGFGEGAAASGARRDTSGGVVISIGAQATASADAVAADLDAGCGGGVAASGERRNTTGRVVIAVDTRDQAWMGRC